MTCAHREVGITFPDGTSVLASGWFVRAQKDPPPDFGLYLYEGWKPTWPADVMEWQDFGVPGNRQEAVRRIIGAFERARSGERVEVGCYGGHGRAGTVLACMAILSGVPASEAVQWVRANYCRYAVESSEQERWAKEFQRPSRDEPQR